VFDFFGDQFVMTNRFTKTALVGTVFAAAIASTGAQAATATATAKAEILQQVTVTKNTDLDYAVIVTGAAASSVTVTPAGARTCGAGLVCTGTVTAADFSVVGTVGKVVTISAPATVSLVSGGNTMSSTLVGSASTLTISATAANNKFQYGGTLTVAANQADGVYTSAPFTVTVNYQ
jgi:Mat/Ecp fimbriae major subunit